jgi:hypothetical protein
VEMRNAARFVMICALMLLPAASLCLCRTTDKPRAAHFDGDWITHLACEAHGETPAYKWEFPSTIKDSNFHGQHNDEGQPGYLVIDGEVSDDGNAKLNAKGTVTQNHAHGIFAMKGNNYTYTIKAQFDDAHGTGTRDEGAGILGRTCTFEFVKQLPPGAAPAASPGAKPDSGQSRGPDAGQKQN